MEKRTPHCKLTVIRSLLEVGKVRVTQSARQGAYSLGMQHDDMIATVMNLVSSDFYKSMTTYDDHQV